MHKKAVSSHALSDFEARFAAMTCRGKRQAFYLSCLQCLSVEESQRFFRIYNELARRQAMSPRVHEWLQAEQSQSPLYRLASHFIDLFGAWLQLCRQHDTMRAQVLYTALEDINVTAISFRAHRNLCHGRRVNQTMKTIKHQALHCSVN